MKSSHPSWLAHLVRFHRDTRIAIAFGFCLLSSVAVAQGPAAREDVRTDSPATAFVVESYYRIRWGGEEEFLALFRKNHLPFVRRQIEKGILLEARFDTPREHMSEEGRWDLRMTLVYRNAASAYAADNISESDYTAIVKNEEAERIFKNEERRRFELLLAHWDVNVKPAEAVKVP